MQHATRSRVDRRTLPAHTRAVPMGNVLRAFACVIWASHPVPTALGAKGGARAIALRLMACALMVGASACQEGPGRIAAVSSVPTIAAGVACAVVTGRVIALTASTAPIAASKTAAPTALRTARVSPRACAITWRSQAEARTVVCSSRLCDTRKGPSGCLQTASRPQSTSRPLSGLAGFQIRTGGFACATLVGSGRRARCELAREIAQVVARARKIARAFASPAGRATTAQCSPAQAAQYLGTSCHAAELNVELVGMTPCVVVTMVGRVRLVAAPLVGVPRHAEGADPAA